jgi:hypothetical protein
MSGAAVRVLLAAVILSLLSACPSGASLATRPTAMGAEAAPSGLITRVPKVRRHPRLPLPNWCFLPPEVHRFWHCRSVLAAAWARPSQ